MSKNLDEINAMNPEDLDTIGDVGEHGFIDPVHDTTRYSFEDMREEVRKWYEDWLEYHPEQK